MKLIQNILVSCSFLTTVCTLHSCSAKEDYREIDFSKSTTVQISATPISGMVNRWLISDETPGAFIHQWDLGLGGGSFSGMKNDTAYYPEQGAYWLKLKSFTPNGWALDSIQITVAEDDPDRCSGSLAILTGCDFKTWVLDNVSPGALWVGSPDGQQWWASGAADVGVRSCLFNDEYTFNINGKYAFDNQGDIWVDDEGGNPWPTDIGFPIGCASFDQIPAKYQAWGSNANHAFTLAGNSLTLTGTGAFVGLYKAGQGGIADAPGAVNTYTIESISPTKIVLVKAYDWGTWKFTIIPKE